MRRVRRQYCARRLRRLYKGVDFLHGKKTFEKRDLTEADVRDVRCYTTPCHPRYGLHPSTTDISCV
jgi:hypothetical protein